ncbi:MBL fold metallo-hydrolase [Cohnella boryungensis]|uniref:MBL fold metallo-hydrolase n=1 Tax=Cohnella boryungensis TaxID=768479 RepID=A0ABV8SGW3_9BACL
MRKLSLSIVALLLIWSSTGAVSAHPGRTDAKGGHTCRTNCAKWGLKDGQYHYHNADGSATLTPPSGSNGKLKADKITPPRKGKLSVYYLNVGQGDATYIKTAEGDDILIDAGKNEAGDVVVDYLKQLGVDDLEVLISTHPDADHSGGLDTVLNAFKVKAVYAPKVSHTTDTFKDFLLAVKKQGLTIKEAKAGVSLPLEGVTAAFVGPTTAYGSNLNDWSAVLHLAYGDNTFLFTGDAEKKSESDMIAKKVRLKADVLKVGHHGSVSSTTDPFLKAVAPQYAIISVGQNSYGHPAASLLSRLKAAKATIYRTDLNGTVTAVSDGKKITFLKVK